MPRVAAFAGIRGGRRGALPAPGKLRGEQPEGRPPPHGWPNETIMEFGHRVYATEDPRGAYLRVTSAGLAGTRGGDNRFRKVPGG